MSPESSYTSGARAWTWVKWLKVKLSLVGTSDLKVNLPNSEAAFEI